MFEIVVEKTFAAAHFLPKFEGPCQRVHGHNWRVRVYLRSRQLDEHGMVADFGRVKAALGAVVDRYDHRTLNDLPEFQEAVPSTENVARFIAEAMTRYDFGTAQVHRVEVRETQNQAATFYVVE
jgi:6-pyruvoyltetrahydropterin/6-carboxytetrahydropterin synthase